eukprot:113023_1
MHNAITAIQYGTKPNTNRNRKEKYSGQNEQKHNDIQHDEVNQNELHWNCYDCAYLNDMNATQCNMCLAVKKTQPNQKRDDNQENKTTKLIHLNGKLKTEVGRLREMNNSLRTTASIERKQYEQQLNSLQLKIKQMKNKTMDTHNWRQWDQNEIIQWIVFVDNNRFAKYEKIVRNAFEEQQVTAHDLPHINENDVFNWGIKILCEKKLLCKYIQQLTRKSNHQQTEGLNEDVTIYM